MDDIICTYGDISIPRTVSYTHLDVYKRQALRRALDECDIVLINGGSSKGEEDFNTEIIEEYGEMISHWVKAAPGRPMGCLLYTSSCFDSSF